MLVKVWEDITSSLCAIENLCQQMYDEYFTLSAKMNVAKDIISHARNSEDNAARSFIKHKNNNSINNDK
jgi:hypothetical protein